MQTADKTEGGANTSQTDFTYTDMGRIDDQKEAYFAVAQKTIDYDYEQSGNRISTTYPDTTTAIDITPDYQGRIATITRNTIDLVTYQYNGSLVAQRDYKTPDIAFEPVYDNLGRVTARQTYNYNTSTDITNFGYWYMPNENNISVKQFRHRSATPPSNIYLYDNLDRVSNVTYHDTVTEAFNMDDLGNRVNNSQGGSANVIRNGATSAPVSYVLDIAVPDDDTDDTNRYLTIGGGSVGYDTAGNLTVDHRGYQYSYDYENRITEIMNSLNTVIAEYAYDALSRRIRKTAGGSTTLYYYNDQWQVLQEFDATGNTAQRYFVYGNYIDEVLLMRDTDATNGVTDGDYYYAHDHLYSPTALTDAAGNVVERYEYNAYGKATVYTNMTDWNTATPTTQTYSAYGNPYQFTGRRQDSLNNNTHEIMYYRNRYYDTETGRFLQQDPLGTRPVYYENTMSIFAGSGKVDYIQAIAPSIMKMLLNFNEMPYRNINQLSVHDQFLNGLSLYQYVSSSPTYSLDPTGLSRSGWPFWVCMVACSAVTALPAGVGCTSAGIPVAAPYVIGGTCLVICGQDQIEFPEPDPNPPVPTLPILVPIYPRRRPPISEA